MMQIDAIESGNKRQNSSDLLLQDAFHDTTVTSPKSKATNCYDIQQHKIKIQDRKKNRSIYKNQNQKDTTQGIHLQRKLIPTAVACSSKLQEAYKNSRKNDPARNGGGGGGERDLPDLGKLEGAKEELSARTKCGSSIAIANAVSEQN